jgi:hypothetical protein
LGVQYRTLKSASASPGKTKLVSDKFVSRATACIVASSRPRASSSTAQALPANGVVVNASTQTTSNERAMPPCSTQHVRAPLRWATWHKMGKCVLLGVSTRARPDTSLSTASPPQPVRRSRALDGPELRRRALWRAYRKKLA